MLLLWCSHTAAPCFSSLAGAAAVSDDDDEDGDAGARYASGDDDDDEQGAAAAPEASEAEEAEEAEEDEDEDGEEEEDDDGDEDFDEKSKKRKRGDASYKGRGSIRPAKRPKGTKGTKPRSALFKFEKELKQTRTAIDKITTGVQVIKETIAGEEKAITDLTGEAYSFSSTAFGEVMMGRTLEERQQITDIMVGILQNTKKIYDHSANLKMYKANEAALVKAIADEKAKAQPAGAGKVSASLEGLFDV